MTTIDISLKAVGIACDRLQAFLDTKGHNGTPSSEIVLIRALSAALTQSRAETAAAYERAADLVDDMRRDPQYSGEGCDPIIEAIRALATPDQTTALDTLVAEVEARAVEKTAEMVRTWRNTTPMTGKECANAILALIGENK